MEYYGYKWLNKAQKCKSVKYKNNNIYTNIGPS